MSGGHKYEYPLKGYDIEVGTPIFAFSDELNEKFGTKAFIAKYKFTNKNTKPINGTRIRLEQKLGSMSLGDGSLYFNLTAETQYDKIRKRQNGVGIGAKYVFNDKKSNRKHKALESRMMDTVIRDVDIVTASESLAPQKHAFVHNGREINKLYYVASTTKDGDGTQEKPFSIEQYNKINAKDAMVIITSVTSYAGGKPITNEELAKLMSKPEVINGKPEIVLASSGEDTVVMKIRGEKGISLITNDDNTSIIVIKDNGSSSALQGTINQATQGKIASFALIEEPVAQELAKQIHTVVEAQDEELQMVQQQNSQAQAREDIRVEAEDAQEREVEREQQRLRTAAIVRAAEIEAAERRRLEAEERERQRLAALNLPIQPEPLLQENPLIEAPIAVIPVGTFDSTVDINTLTVEERELYNLILAIENIKLNPVINAGDPYIMREVDYNFVNDIITANSQEDIDQIHARIDGFGLDVDKTNDYKLIATRIKKYKGEEPVVAAQQGGQQGIGFAHFGPRDITGTASLVKLQEQYGVVDGASALQLMKRFVKDIIIKTKVGDLTEQEIINAATTIPGDVYRNAAMEYIRLSKPVVGETPLAKQQRLASRVLHKEVIDKEVNTGRTSVNQYLAAYRALKRIENDPNGLFVEEIAGKYDIPMVIGHMIIAAGDAGIAQELARQRNELQTPRGVFDVQKKNLEALVQALGSSQRAYNGNDEIGDVNGEYSGIVDVHRNAASVWTNAGNGGSSDSVSCAHGVCSRIIDAGWSTGHPSIILSDNTPANLALDLSQTFKRTIEAIDDQIEKDGLINFHERVTEITHEMNGQNLEFKFKMGPNVVENENYHNAVLKVAETLDKNYFFLNSNPKLRLIKQKDALDMFRNLIYVDDLRQ